MSHGSVRVLIDGYNLMHQTPTMQSGSGSIWLHQQRLRLIQVLADAIEVSQRSTMMIVFDAHTDRSPNTTDFVLMEIRVRFAHEHNEADDLIEDIIEQHPAPKSLLVVSSDRRIKLAAKYRQAQAVDSREWFEGIALRQSTLTETCLRPPKDDPEAIKNGIISQYDVETWSQYLEMEKIAMADTAGNRPSQPKRPAKVSDKVTKENPSPRQSKKSRATKAPQKREAPSPRKKTPSLDRSGNQNPLVADESGIDPKILKRANRKLPDDGPLFPEDYFDGFS